MTGSFDVNRANWDERAPLHAAAEQYAVRKYVDDPEFLSHVVRFDRPRLGDVAGLRGVHLQCHIGTDTLSLSRLGARMSGLDLSPASLTEARKLASAAGADIDYREANVYAAAEVFGEGGFDLVYTGIGALCWLPRIADWASVVARLLRPGGRLFIREAHPMLWTLDDETERAWPRFGYFELDEPMVWNDENTYVDTERPLRNTTTHEWNHSLGEIITALLDNGLSLTGFTEHDSVPWNALPKEMAAGDDGEWRMRENPGRLAASYTLQAVKGS
ncbi:class I SAM-dependent methyltransferase [Amycolatopsis saalfeldensis]|uniref:Methyltransferase domain-containing protein n=1 Tax=Amycolatopsis saalfeldensis TaxID=394193 RepID=A0A1H8YH55_9PSEU|nr:class I SAM-dependent methyltransferase [Amycolatopsis saalfeldensis]SEP51403.1 Methyltransferase domain-containing protein [Amycolatopsis saalfeldensis]